MEPSVLIVSNDNHIRDILKNALLAERFKVVCQTSSLNAVAKCVEIKPDVVLLDVALPEMAELPILEGIRLSSPSVPVVIIGSNATAGLVKNVLSKGASDIIIKPFTIARVLEVLNKLVKSSSRIGNVAA